MHKFAYAPFLDMLPLAMSEISGFLNIEWAFEGQVTNPVCVCMSSPLAMGKLQLSKFGGSGFLG